MAALIHSIGISEVPGAAGLILSWYTGIRPVLAVCFAVMMVPAARTHYRLKEPGNIANNTLLFLLPVFVAWVALCFFCNTSRV